MPVWVWLAIGGGGLWWYFNRSEEGPAPPTADAPADATPEELVSAAEMVPADHFGVLERTGGVSPDELTPLCQKLLTVSANLMPFLPRPSVPKTFTPAVADDVIADLMERLDGCFGEGTWSDLVFEGSDLAKRNAKGITWTEGSLRIESLRAFIHFFLTPSRTLSDFVGCMEATVTEEAPVREQYLPGRTRLRTR